MSQEIESIFNLPKQKVLGPDVFTDEFYQIKGEIVSLLYSILHNVKESFYLFFEASITLVVKPGKDIRRKPTYRPGSHE